MKKLTLVSILLAVMIPSCAKQSEKRSGIVDRIQGKEIYVHNDNPAKPFVVGEILRMNLDEGIVRVKVVFIMKTEAICNLAATDAKKIALIKKGQVVYAGQAVSDAKIDIGEAKSEGYSIGDRGPSGGLIFYDKGNRNGGWRYLEAAPEDQSNGITWWNGKYLYIGRTGTKTGSGRANTRNILAAQGDGNYAAKICADYRGGGKSDWFLPSKDELVLMHVNLSKQHIQAFAGEFYWSSSEVDGSLAWLQVFTGDNLHCDDKDFAAHVHAIRAF